MKVRFNRWYNAVLTALLGLLGFESCSNGGNELCEYGTPTADYTVKGVVTDEEGNPIQGILTKFVGDYNYGEQSTMTDKSGNYKLQVSTFPGLHNCQLIVKDIDGEANGGEFQSDTLDLSTQKTVQVQKGDGNWYDGAFEITQDVKLKK